MLISGVAARASTTKPATEALTEAKTWIVKASDSLDSISDRFERDAAWVEIGRAQARCGDIAGAMNSATRPSKASMSDLVYSSIARVQLKRGSTAAAIATIRQMETAMWAATDFAEAGDVAAAIAAAGKIRDDNGLIQANSLRLIACTLARRGNVEGAKAALDAINEDGLVEGAKLKKISITQVVAALAAGGHEAQAETLNSELGGGQDAVRAAIAIARAERDDIAGAEAVAKQIAGRMPDELDRELAKAHARAGRFEQAERLIARTTDADERARLCCAVAESRMKLGHTADATRLYKEALTATRNVKAWDPRYDDYELIIKSQIRTGRMGEAAAGAKECIDFARHTGGDFSHAVCLLARAGDSASAMRLASELADPHQAHERAMIYVEVGLTEARHRTADRFMEWCASLDDPLQRTMACVGAASAALADER